MHPTDKDARIAGAVYLSLVLSAPFSLLYVPGKLIVTGNATATATSCDRLGAPVKRRV